MTWRTKRAPSYYTARTNIAQGTCLGVPNQSAFTDQLIQTSESNSP